MPKAKLDPPPPPQKHRRRTLSDPLAVALLPPPDESPIDREVRLKAEIDAKKVSDSIDDMIRQERIDQKKSKAAVNVLLLGQSESGKSTTLKQFQLMHTPSVFQAERIAWRTVIYLNLVRSIRRILDALAPESDVLDEHDDGDSESLETASVIITSNGRPPSAILGTPVSNYTRYRHKLEPLIELEERLIRMLSSSEEDEPDQLGLQQHHWPQQHWQQQQFPNERHIHSTSRAAYRSAPSSRPSPIITIPQTYSPTASMSSTNNNIPSPSTGSSKGNEVMVHTSTNWKKVFAFGRSKSPKSPHSGEIEGWWEDPDDPVHVLNACGPTMSDLWRDKQVRARLEEKRLRLEESSGFYLDEIPRITAKKYFPTDADVLKARLKTVGVVEHTFSINSGSNRGVEWRIYDVGGSRNQRQAWAPYFDDVNAIIFLAPISAFDQVLVEDPRVNRLEDSLILWTSVVSNKLLANVNVVLFLNKCDLLQAKLEAGVRLNQHMISYGDRPNDYDSVSTYFRHKFGVIHHSYTPNKEREFYIHLTAVTDTRRTTVIISSVRDMIIKGNLRNMRLV